MVDLGIAMLHFEIGAQKGTWTWGNPAVYELSLIHISEPTRLGMISYAVFCLKKKKKKKNK